MGSRTISDIIINTHRKWIRFLKHHSDPLTQQIDIHIPIDILSIQSDISVNPASLNQIIHSIEGFQQCGFSTAARPDKRRNLTGADI